VNRCTVAGYAAAGGRFSQLNGRFQHSREHNFFITTTCLTQAARDPSRLDGALWQQQLETPREPARADCRGGFTAMPKINEICNLIASLEMKPADAELLRKMMFDFRVRHPAAYRDLMQIPGMARVWTTTETLVAWSGIEKRGT